MPTNILTALVSHADPIPPENLAATPTALASTESITISGVLAPSLGEPTPIITQTNLDSTTFYDRIFILLSTNAVLAFGVLAIIAIVIHRQKKKKTNKQRPGVDTTANRKEPEEQIHATHTCEPRPRNARRKPRLLWEKRGIVLFAQEDGYRSRHSHQADNNGDRTLPQGSSTLVRSDVSIPLDHPASTRVFSALLPIPLATSADDETFSLWPTPTTSLGDQNKFLAEQKVRNLSAAEIERENDLMVTMSYRREKNIL